MLYRHLTIKQNRFPDDPTIYPQFLKILTDSQKDPGPKSSAEAEQRIKVLFGNHPDLIEGFQQFLPAEGAQNEGAASQSPGAERQRKLLEIFAAYNENPTSTGELSGTLKELFGDDPEMVKLLDQQISAVKEEQK